MAQSEQVFGHLPCRAMIVQADGGVGALRKHFASVDQWRKVDAALFDPERIEGTQLNDAVGLVGIHQFSKFTLDRLLPLSVAQQNPVAGCMRGLLRAADNPGEKAVGNMRDQDDQVSGLARPELDRHEVGPIACLFHSRVDAIASIREHPVGGFERA